MLCELWYTRVLAFASVALCVKANVISFNDTNGFQLAGPGIIPSIIVAENDYIGVQRAAGDLAQDFGRVTGQNGTVHVTNDVVEPASIIAGTIGHSAIIDRLVFEGQLKVDQTQNKWEAYQIQLMDFNGTSSLVIAGADKRGTIYGIYEISQQIGVSPWYFWADVPTMHRETIFASTEPLVRGSPGVKYRGIFINDEQPGLTNWVRRQYPDVEYGAGFTHRFYATVFELILRQRASLLWPASWGSMFYFDDPLNAQTADDYGIVMGTSHTEPMTRATNEQANFMNGSWSWADNRDNVTEFMREGAVRTRGYETLYTMGMRGLGDVAGDFNASSLEEVINVQQSILQEVYGTTNLSGIPQVWTLYNEVGGFYEDGLKVPEDVTILFAEDNQGNARRLPISGLDTNRPGGAGLYYHADLVGAPRSYKWIFSVNLQKQWYELQQAYARGADRIWVLNVGDLKPLEIPMTHFFDVAYNVTAWSQPDSTHAWLSKWAVQSFGEDVAPQISQILRNYTILARRRRYELLDSQTYSIINYNEDYNVLAEWQELASAAQSVYDSLAPEAMPAFFEMVLHPTLAGQLLHQLYINVAHNNLYSGQWRTSTNSLAYSTIQLFDDDHMLTQRYHDLLNGKWKGMMDQTHINYRYWQQPMRQTLPPLSFVQQREVSLAGPIGVACVGSNASVPGDDQYHTLSSDSISLPPMDPFGPDRWIEVFSRGIGPVTYNVTCDEPAVSFYPTTTGALGLNGSDLDTRIYVTVDWSQVTNISTVTTINITTTTISQPDDINATDHLYGSFGMPQINLILNKTSVPDEGLPVGTFVESDRHISMEAAHYTNITNTSSESAYLYEIPGLSRTLSGISLGPFVLEDTLSVDDSTPHLTYDFYTFTTAELANLTLHFVPALNTNGNRTLKYAARLSPSSPITGSNATGDIQTVQPIPTTSIGVLPPIWDEMVANANLASNTTWNLTETGAHKLDVWLLEPGLVLQKIVIDLGGVVQSYLGPPESYRWSA